MKTIPLVLFMTSMLLAGCGDSSSSTSANNSRTSAAPNTFKDTIIPAGFNWEMRSSKWVNFKHVSNISQLDGIPINITGKHYIEIYSIDENNNTSPSPFLKAMTTSKGDVEILLTLLNSWKGITVKTQLHDSICINTLYKEQIAAIQTLDCDVVFDSDLL
jgi:hypothetical protein